MFANAFEKAAKFTRPLIISTRQVDGSVTANCATFFLVNSDGWFITAGHVFDSFQKFQGDQNKIKEVNERNAATALQTPSQSKGLALELPTELKLDPKWITNHSFWFGWDGVRMVEAYVNRQVDIAVGRLEGFKPGMVEKYPVFRNPNTVRPGTSVCRLGFPFAPVATDFDDKTKSFRIRPGVLPLPFFPNEGIHTRNILNGKSKEGNYDLLYVETSSPGLPGQSGGPIFDAHGLIYAMQVQTLHLPLGTFQANELNGQTVVENQFYHTGVGVHTRIIQEILRDRHVRFDSESGGEGDQGDKFVINS